MDNRIFIDSPCNGKGICGKCKVKVVKGLKEPTPLDIKHLTKEELESGFRLSCNLTINEDVEIVLLEKNKDMEVLINGTEQQYTLDTVVKKKYLAIEKQFNVFVLFMINGNFKYRNKLLNGNVYITEEGIIIASIENKPFIVERINRVNIKLFELVNDVTIKIATDEDRNYEIRSYRSAELYEKLQDIGWLENINKY
jgi:uncharacterized 2Fe-2S/4Fe-4S cluster protein (DUF4445 family)